MPTDKSGCRMYSDGCRQISQKDCNIQTQKKKEVRDARVEGGMTFKAVTGITAYAMK